MAGVEDMEEPFGLDDTTGKHVEAVRADGIVRIAFESAGQFVPMQQIGGHRSVPTV